MKDLILKDIDGFPGYKAGSDGDIYSYLKMGRASKLVLNTIPRKLKAGIDGLGKYLFVILRKNNKSYTKTIHRIICESFNGKPVGNQDASHLDGDRRNNIPTNLIWESRSENCQRKKAHGTDDIGIKNKRAIFNMDQLVQIRKWLAEGVTSKEISKRMNCDGDTIGKIKRGERYMGQGKV